MSPEDVDAHTESFMDLQAWMAANGMTNGMSSALLVPVLRLPALPDAAAPAPASQQDARVPLPASGDDCDVSMNLTAELAGIIYVLEEDIPAHVEARIAEICDFFKGQFNDGARRVEQHAREHCEMRAVASREEAHHELISVEGSSAYRQARFQEELVRPRHGEEQSAGLWRIEMANDHA